MRKFTPWGRRALIAITPLVFAMSAAASDDISPGVRAAMQRDLGMTPAQLNQYQRVERMALAQARLSAKATQRDFAGTWIERGPNGAYRLVVATTSARVPKASGDVVYRGVRHNLAALDSAKDELDLLAAQAGRPPQGIYGWHVDLKSNSVTVNVAPGAQAHAIDFVAASGADAGTIRFQTMASAPRPLATFYGGSEYLSRSGGSYYYCSVGFNVTRNGTAGFATAGHCGNAGDTVHTAVGRSGVSAAIGSFQASSFPNGDRAWVALTGTHTQPATVDGYNQADIAVRGSAVAPIGAAVCRSGRTTGMKCGTIQAYNVTVQYPDASVGGLTQVKVCAEGGDSGGPFITGAGQAQGVLSGGNYSCKGKQAQLATSYFQPIGPILQGYGLTLKVTP